MTSSTGAGASGGNMAGGMSQLSANGASAASQASKTTGAGASERSQLLTESLYGVVKAPKRVSPPETSGNVTKLRNKVKQNFLCGMGGIILALILSSALFFCGFLSMRGNFLFFEAPNVKKLAIPIPGSSN